MDENMMVMAGAIALAPFYTMGVILTGYALAFVAHMLRRVDESTKKTELTETLTTKNGAQVAVK